MLEYIDAKTLRLMFLAGAKNLDSKKEWINELNVFPVPDGDTGTNMTLTVMSAFKEVIRLTDSSTINEIGKTIATGTLRGARGNSGVIMSQLCRGFSKGIEGVVRIDNKVIADSFDRAVTTAYKAVMKPKEGTILTVAKAASAKATELASSDEEMNMEDFFREIIDYAELILSKTPDMLPVLKEAGVVDSGGQGLVEFLKGAYDAFCGKEIDLSAESSFSQTQSLNKSVDTSSITTADIKFGYCTEFIIETDKVFTDHDELEFKAFLEDIGDSIVCVNMDDIVKVHVHTNHPGNAIEKALTYGSLVNLKIDNMRKEHTEKVIKEADRALAREKETGAETAGLNAEPSSSADPDKIADTAAENLPHHEYGFVAVCTGDGIEKIFKGMGVEQIITGGQTMNPSTDDILDAISKVNADYVFVLPNNGNIIMAANQASMLCTDKKVLVVPSKTICQGINAVINYVQAKSPEDNIPVMEDAVHSIKTGEVTYAVRNTKIDGKKIRKGDFMGIGEGEILSVSTDVIEAAVEMITAMIDEDDELVTIYYGADTTEVEAEQVADALADRLSDDIDIEIAYGGQPVYCFFTSIE